MEKNGNKQFVVLPYEEFMKIQEELADYEDIRLLREAKHKEGDAPTIDIEDVKKQLNIE